MSLVFVDAQSASLFTSVLLISHDTECLTDCVQNLSRCSPYYNLLKASTGDDALEVVRSKRLDCIVLDLDLPNVGLTLLTGIISVRHQLPSAVIVLTDTPSNGVRRMALGMGANTCLGKASFGLYSLDRIVQDAVLCDKKALKHRTTPPHSAAKPWLN